MALSAAAAAELVRPTTDSSPRATNTMHWAPIPIAEFALPPAPSDFHVADEDVFRLLSRAPRRGFWISAAGFIALLTGGLICFYTGYTLVGVLLFVFSVAAGTGNILVRHKINAAIWITREPAAVYWAAPREYPQMGAWSRQIESSVTLYTPAAGALEASLAHDELITVLHWLRQRNPDALIGSYSATDSDGRLSGNDPWSPRTT